VQRLTRIFVALLVTFAAGPALAGGALAVDSGQTVSADGQTATTQPAQLGDEVVCEFPVGVTDGTNTTVRLDEEPQEIVVTAPNIAQHMWEIGAQDKVVGMPVAPQTAYLDGSQNKTSVTNNLQPDREKIVDLDPDLVLVGNINSQELVENLRSDGLTVYYYPRVNSLDGMYEQLETVGRLVGNFDEAATTTAEIAGKVRAIEEAVADEERPKVYYEFFDFTVSSDTLEHDLITRAGGNNIATEGDAPRPYFELSDEVIVQQDPEWLILQEGAPIPDSPAVQESTAIQENQTVRVNPNFISQHGPRNLDPLLAMAEAFHPDAVDAADVENADPVEASQCAAAAATPTPTPTPDPTPTPEPTPTETPDSTPTETVEPTSDDDDGAGFTPIVSAVAVVAFALVVRRRR
jgi:iron complex transport system substrate-binding protein